MSARLVPTPGCGVNDWWCHGTCRRHGQCMYVQRAPLKDTPPPAARVSVGGVPYDPATVDRSQLAAYAADPPARAHNARLERNRQDRASLAADHWAD